MATIPHPVTAMAAADAHPPVIVTVHEAITTVTTKLVSSTDDLGLPLHLLPPFTSLPFTSTTLTSAGSFPSSPTSSAAPVAYPYGPAPLPPLPSDPMGVSHVSAFYSSAPSFFFLALGIAATLQLCLTHKRLLHAPHITALYGHVTTPLSKLPFLALDPYLQMEIQNSVYHVVQLLALIPLNFAAIDLLFRLVSLENHWFTATPASQPDWKIHAGQAGPPLSLLAWGLTLSGVRICLSGARWINARSRLYRGGTDIFVRAFTFELLGAALPAAVVGFPALRAWSWNAGSGHIARDPKMSPADYIPALYMDGMWDNIHGYLLEYVFSLGVWISVVPGFVLIIVGSDWENNWHGQFMKRVVPVSPVWLVLMFWIFLMLMSLLLSMLGRGLLWLVGSPWEEADVFLAEYMSWVGPAMYLPTTPVIAVMGVVWFAVLVLPIAIGWYVVEGWLHAGIDVSRSCFFVPCAEGTKSSFLNRGMVAFGACLVGYHVWLLLRRSAGPGSEKQREWTARGDGKIVKKKARSIGKE